LESNGLRTQQSEYSVGERRCANYVSFDPLKFANAAAYLAGRCSDLTKMKVSKLLFFADKAHLLCYGRTVIGDRYIKMEFGPIPFSAYNLMKRDDRATAEDQEVFDVVSSLWMETTSKQRRPLTSTIFQRLMSRPWITSSISTGI
jgi:uncharacterized phage-associated protein